MKRIFSEDNIIADQYCNESEKTNYDFTKNSHKSNYLNLDLIGEECLTINQHLISPSPIHVNWEELQNVLNKYDNNILLENKTDSNVYSENNYSNFCEDNNLTNPLSNLNISNNLQQINQHLTSKKININKQTSHVNNDSDDNISDRRSIKSKYKNNNINNNHINNKNVYNFNLTCILNDFKENNSIDTSDSNLKVKDMKNIINYLDSIKLKNLKFSINSSINQDSFNNNLSIEHNSHSNLNNGILKSEDLICSYVFKEEAIKQLNSCENNHIKNNLQKNSQSITPRKEVKINDSSKPIKSTFLRKDFDKKIIYTYSQELSKYSKKGYKNKDNIPKKTNIINYNKFNYLNFTNSIDSSINSLNVTENSIFVKKRNDINLQLGYDNLNINNNSNKIIQTQNNKILLNNNKNLNTKNNKTTLENAKQINFFSKSNNEVNFKILKKINANSAGTNLDIITKYSPYKYKENHKLNQFEKHNAKMIILTKKDNYINISLPDSFNNNKLNNVAKNTSNYINQINSKLDKDINDIYIDKNIITNSNNLIHNEGSSKINEKIKTSSKDNLNLLHYLINLKESHKSKSNNIFRVDKINYFKETQNQSNSYNKFTRNNNINHFNRDINTLLKNNDNITSCNNNKISNILNNTQKYCLFNKKQENFLFSNLDKIREDTDEYTDETNEMNWFQKGNDN